MGSAAAQSVTTGAVQGRVVDHATKEPLAGVTVVAIGASPEPQSTLTEEDGTYKITELLPGVYVVTFYIGDLTVSRSGIRVSANDITPVHQKIRLTDQPGTIIEVDSPPPQINPHSTTKGSKYDRRHIERVPTQNRGFEGTAGNQAGTHNDGVGLAVSGSTSLENRYLVDGIDITGLTYGTVGTPILSEFIEEVEVIAGGYNAEWGRAIGGIVNVITRSGSNTFRGSVFGTMSPGFLAKRGQSTPVNASSIDVESNRAYSADFGVELGGPILKDRLFFYVGFAPQLARTDYTRITKRQTDCRQLLPSGELSGCDPRLSSQGGYADGTADVDPATGFYITDELDRDVRSGSSQQYSALAKLNLAVSPKDQAQLSMIAVPSRGESPGLYGLPSSGGRSDGLTTDAALRWTSKLNEDRTEVEALVAWHRSTSNSGSIDPSLDSQPRQILRGGNLGTWSGLGGESARTAAGCTDGGAGDPYSAITNCPMETVSYAIGGPGSISRDSEDRRMARLTATQRLRAAGTHELKVGLDFESDTKETSRLYSGGAFLQNDVGNSIRVTRWVQLAPAGDKDPRFDQMCSTADAMGGNGMAGTKTYACDFLSGTPGAPGTSIVGSTINWAAFLRDSWAIRPNLVFNAGVRYEEQRLRYASNLQGTDDPLTGNKIGKDAMTLDKNFAPRLGLIWDPTKIGASKIFGSWGRFYESIPMDINDRSFGGEVSFTQTFTSGQGRQPCGPTDPRIGGPDGVGCLTPSGPATQETLLGSSGVLVAPGIKAQYMDEVLAGVEYQLSDNLKLGITYQNRQLGRVIEDVSTDGASTYIIANPGEWSKEEETKLLQRIARTDDAVTRGRLERQLTLYKGIRGFDRPLRRYDAIELNLARQFSKGLFAQASYTYSRTQGNYPGSLSYDNGQIDPNISSQYDLIELLANRTGKLPQDRPHSVKVDGHYKFDLGENNALTFGGRIRMVSGVPKSALGAHYLYGPDESFVLPRGVMGRSEIQHGIDVHLAYARKLSKTMTAEVYFDVFNLYDNQGTFDTDQTYAPAVRRTAPGAGGGSENNVNPIVGGGYEDLMWAKTIDSTGNETGVPTARNPNFGKATSRYSPTSARIGFRLTF
ncbi:MAG: TonB-dependent receptor [Deltaproteobacteria bacterium]|nr:TonB-dependent receptor [Deltaproteobacteria bacterium]